MIGRKILTIVLKRRKGRKRIPIADSVNGGRYKKTKELYGIRTD